MRRHCLTAIATALVLAMVTPSAGWARADVVVRSGAGCCIDVGVRLTVSFDDGAIRGTVSLPGLGARLAGSSLADVGTPVRSGFEIFSVALDVPDAVRWGIPIVSIVAGVTTARTNRLATESGLFQAEGIGHADRR